MANPRSGFVLHRTGVIDTTLNFCVSIRAYRLLKNSISTAFEAAAYLQGLP